MNLVGGAIEENTKPEAVPYLLIPDLLILDLLRQQGRCCLRVSGTSMLPTLWPGDLVSVKRPSASRMSVGDIVLYRRSGRFFLHRLVALPDRSGGGFVARGDSMPHADSPVAVDEIVGVLEGVSHGESWLAVPSRMPVSSRLAGGLLARSSGLVRLVMRVRACRAFSRETLQRGESVLGVALPEAPGS